MPKTPELETDRLRLKPLMLTDAPAVQRRFPRWAVVQFLAAGIPWPYPDDGAESYIRATLTKMEAGTRSAWGLWLKDGPAEVIGLIELWPPDPVTRDSRGFWLDPEFRRRGLMTEAADRVVDYAFGELGWPFLWVGNAKPNIASAKIKERQGALLIDEVPARVVSGETVRQVWLLRAADWKQRRGSNTGAR